MQLRELEIDRFGVWQDVSFPFNERGVTVLYGPNEAGKSTLMRFIRGVLYGFLPQDERTMGPHARPVECAGTLRVSHQGQDYRLRRTSQPGTRGRLEINGRIVPENDPVLKSLVGDTPELLFQNIFAIGLNELQQLATLNGEEVARHIYGLSLGPEGEQIFRAQSGLAEKERRLIGAEKRDGELFSRLQQLGQIDRELAKIGPATEKHGRLQSQLRAVEDDIASAKSRQAEIQHELNGRRFLSRVWEPWKRERELSRKLAQLPQDDLDRDLLARFDELELELSEIDDRRKALIAEAQQLQHTAEAIQTRPELEQHACTIQSLFEKNRGIQELERSLPDARAAGEARQRELAPLLAKLGDRWDARRLEQLEVTPEALQRLLVQADGYRRSVRRWLRLQKRYERWLKALKKHQTTWKALTKDLGNQPLAEVRKSLQRRLHELEELRGLRLRRDHLAKTLEFLNRDLAPTVMTRELPPFFWLILWFFVFSGVVLLGAGIYAAIHGYDGIVAGRSTAWIVGGCYALLGLGVMGTTWSMKEYFETLDFSSPETGREREALEHELDRVEQAIDRITRRDAAGATNVPPPAGTVVASPVSEEETIRALRQRLLELDQHEPIGRKIESLRRRLTSLRQEMQERQRQLGNSRRSWTDVLRRMGLTETLKVSSAFAQCQHLTQAQAVLKSHQDRKELENYQRREIEVFYQQVRDLGEKLEGRGFQSQNSFESLAEWDRELQLQGERRRERSQLRQAAKEKRRESAQLADQIERMRQQRTSLLKRLGVASREEIAAKLAAIDERNTLAHQRQTVREEIQKLAESEPELALVEEDLVQFETTDNNQAMDQLREELAALEHELQKQFESLGTVKRQLREVENDRTLTSLRFEREQVVHDIRETVEKWCAIRMADRVVDLVRHRIEQERQPRTLQAASDYLHRLTCGKYRKIWTRLGEKALLVDDDQGQSLRVEHLSSGTREQVFLAVRLAMIRDFADQGTELPMVLDDVTVNFDQLRTEAAARTLSEVAADGQQIMLLTCHLHLAQLFQAQGIQPIWLPSLRGENLHAA